MRICIITPPSTKADNIKKFHSNSYEKTNFSSTFTKQTDIFSGDT